MTAVIVILAAVTALIIGFGVSGTRSLRVTALTSPGSLSQRGILSCASEPDTRVGSTAIQWAKEGAAGLVHKFQGGKDHLQEQDVMFQGRTAVSADQVIGGNASLELRDVQLSDAGTCQCSITTARGSGAAVLQYRTGAFSTPEIHVEKSSRGDRLRCEAPRWFPRPAVSWTAAGDAGGHPPRAANSSYQLNAQNITLKVVSFLHNVTANVTYTCAIENSIARATGSIKVTDLGVTRGTSLQLLNLNAESVSSSLPACDWMLLLPLYLLLI